MFKKLLLGAAIALMFCAVPSHAQLKVLCTFKLEENTRFCEGYPCAQNVGPMYTFTKCADGGTLACSWRSSSGQCCNTKYDSDTLYDPYQHWEECQGDAGVDTKSKRPARRYRLENPEFAQLLVFNRCLGTYDSIELIRVNRNKDVYWRP